MRTLVIGDIHGGLLALHQIMDRAQVNTEDTLIFLGDYVDGWSQSPQLIDYLMELVKTHKCIFIMGNHDQLLLKWLDENKDNPMWYKHGGESTVLAYKKVSKEKIQKHIVFFKSMQNYYIDEQNRLFIHAGFTNLNGVTSEFFPELFYWDRTLWETALALDENLDKNDPLYPKRFNLYKEIFIGHTPLSRIGKNIPVKKANIWNIDTGAAFKGPLTMMDIDTNEFWQSDPLPYLYPNEKGRN